jgi:hypothetical protein
MRGVVAPVPTTLSICVSSFGAIRVIGLEGEYKWNFENRNHVIFAFKPLDFGLVVVGGITLESRLS